MVKRAHAELVGMGYCGDNPSTVGVFSNHERPGKPKVGLERPPVEEIMRIPRGHGTASTGRKRMIFPAPSFSATILCSSAFKDLYFR